MRTPSLLLLLALSACSGRMDSTAPAPPDASAPADVPVAPPPDARADAAVDAAVEQLDAAGDAAVAEAGPIEAGPDPLFDPALLHEIALELPPSSVQAINAEARPPFICAFHSREYHAGTLILDGVRYEGVGVRARGNGTADTLDGKPGLKINLEWDDPAVPGCPAPRRLHGKKKLNLLNMRQDPSFVRVILAGELDRLLGVPQPRASWARLTINGSYAGIVTLAENIDRQFLSQWFLDNDGMMYEAGCRCDLVAANVPPPGSADGTTCFERDFGPPGPCDDPAPEREAADWEGLRTFVGALEALPAGGFYPAIEGFFDFDAFLSLWAAQLFLGSGDGYFLNQNSYRLYHDRTAGKYALLDHGSADGIMRTFSDFCAGPGLLALGPSPSIFHRASVLVERCLAERDCQDAYAARMWQVVHDFERFGLEARATALHSQILPEARQDPRYYYNACGNHDYTFAEIEAHFTDYVLPWIRRRFAEVRQELLAAGYPEPR